MPVNNYTMNRLFTLIVALALVACGNGEGGEQHEGGHDTSGSAMSTPSAIDTAQHPNGMTNGSVISRDTAAMKADTNLRP
jgi:hypothetical protein